MRWSSRIPTGFHVSCGTLDTHHLNIDATYETFTLFGQPFQIVQLPMFNDLWVLTLLISLPKVWAVPISLATTFGIVKLLSFPPVNEMFQFTGFPLIHYFICVSILHLQCSEFPHSEIRGSTLICSSPQLIAACHVLLRRLVPRHPPYALCSLIV